MFRSRLLIAPLLAVGSLTLPRAASAQSYNMFDYWLTPSNLVANFSSQNHNGTPGPAGQRKFWRGTMSGKTVALQGDPSYTKYDVFVEEATKLSYWGTFRSNNYTSISPDNDIDSHAFGTPVTFINKTMAIADPPLDTTVTTKRMGAKFRKVTETGTSIKFRTDIDAHYTTWTDPNSGIVWSDVLQMSFWSAYTPSDPNHSKEVYYLAKGKGWVHYDTPDTSVNPAHVWVTSTFTQAQGSLPYFPWWDPFKNTSFATNGYFEDFITSPVNGGLITTYLRGWTSNNSNGKITTDGTIPPGVAGTGTGPWKIALVGGAGAQATVAYPTACIPVVAGATYRLSGYIWRVSTQDNAYLDFNDGTACTGTGSFTDAQAMSVSTATWELRSATTTVGTGVTGIRIRAVRDGANAGNAYFDHVLLERLN